MKSILMYVKIIVFLVLAIFSSLAKGQNKDLLNQYVYKQFDVLPSIEISYTNGDIVLDPKPRFEGHELSFRKVEELKDSFKISNNLSYLVSIKSLYKQLNEFDSWMQYLWELTADYQEKQHNNPTDTELLHKLCWCYIELGKPIAAIEFADRIIDINPLDSVAIFINSILNMSIGNIPEAKKYCSMAMDEFPENAGTYILKTAILLCEEFLRLSASESFEGFKSDFSFLQKATDTYPNNPEIQLAALSGKLFVLYMKILMPYFKNPPKNHQTIKPYLSNCDSLRLDSYKNQYLIMLEQEEYKNHYILYYSLGAIHFLKGEYSQSIDDIKKSIDLRRFVYHEDADVEVSYNNIMTCYLFMGDTLNAKKWTKMKIEDNVSNKSLPQHYIELARYDLIKGRLRKGEKLLNKAIALDSTAHEAYVELANIEMIKNNLKQAEMNLDKCFKIDPEDENLHKSFILLTLYQGDLKTAKYLVDRLLSNTPEDSFGLGVKRDFLE